MVVRHPIADNKNMPVPEEESPVELCICALSWSKLKTKCAVKMCEVVTGTYCTDLEDWDLNLLNSPGAVHSVPSCNGQDGRHRSERVRRKRRGEKGSAHV